MPAADLPIDGPDGLRNVSRTRAIPRRQKSMPVLVHQSGKSRHQRLRWESKAEQWLAVTQPSACKVHEVEET